MKLKIWLMFTSIVKNIILSAARKSDEMLEPYDGKLSRTVLRWERGSNPSDLVDEYITDNNLKEEIMNYRIPLTQFYLEI